MNKTKFPEIRELFAEKGKRKRKSRQQNNVKGHNGILYKLYTKRYKSVSRIQKGSKKGVNLFHYNVYGFWVKMEKIRTWIFCNCCVMVGRERVRGGDKWVIARKACGWCMWSVSVNTESEVQHDERMWVNVWNKMDKADIRFCFVQMQYVCMYACAQVNHGECCL